MANEGDAEAVMRIARDYDFLAEYEERPRRWL
jgi:hypothetical protein